MGHLGYTEQSVMKGLLSTPLPQVHSLSPATAQAVLGGPLLHSGYSMLQWCHVRAR